MTKLSGRRATGQPGRSSTRVTSIPLVPLVLMVGAVVVSLLAASCSSSGGSASSAGATSSTTRGKPAPLYPTSSATSSDGKVTLSTVSAPAPYVSGGHVMVEVRRVGTDFGASTALKLEVDGQPATVAPYSPDISNASGEASRLVTDLAEGSNAISATVGGSTATLKITNHSIQGPVFSGPRQTPFACTTEGAGLGPSSPPDCAAPTKVSWHYVSTDGTVKPLADPSKPPADLASTTVAGQSRPAYVYDETGVIDRSIYEIAVPVSTTIEMPHSGLDTSRWNKRLVYRFGGGCGTTYSQGSDLAGVLDAKLLAKGYAVATSTLDTFQSACNAVLSAEVTMMVKQHFIETYGPPDFTIGDGGSGGSIQQLQIAQNYPGLLDGLSPELPFPDAISISAGVSDCTLLNTYYQGAGSSLTAAQRTAVNGHATDQTCDLWQASFGQEIKADSCGSTVSKDQVFDPETNPKGVRCTLQDGNINVLGTDPATGFAYRPVTNVGVQYGLKALESHVITVDQFLALNAAVGGFDANGNVVAARTTAPDKAFEIAYANGARRRGRRALERADHPHQPLRRSDRRHPRPVPVVQHPRPVDQARRHRRSQPGDLDGAGPDELRRRSTRSWPAR